MEVGIHLLVELIEAGGVYLPDADFVEQVDELGFLLAVDLLQFDVQGIEFPIGVRPEEEGVLVVGTQVLVDMAIDHRGQLEGIAYEEHLHPTEGVVGASICPQNAIHHVHQVGTHHRHLVDDEQLELA